MNGWIVKYKCHTSTFLKGWCLSIFSLYIIRMKKMGDLCLLILKGCNPGTGGMGEYQRITKSRLLIDLEKASDA